MNKSESYNPDLKPSMLLSSAQLDEFKAEGTLAIPGLIPPDVLEGWQDQMRAACSGGVTSTTPVLGLTGGMHPRVVGLSSARTCTMYRAYSPSWSRSVAALLPPPTRRGSRGRRRFQ